jgi:hypothetical protein
VGAGRVIYVAAGGNPGAAGVSPERPAALAVAQALLAAPTARAAGLTVLLRRGDRWRLPPRERCPMFAAHGRHTALLVRASGEAGAPLTIGAWGEGPRPILEGEGLTGHDPQGQDRSVGLLLEGARHVAVRDLELRGFRDGARVISTRRQQAPVRGPAQIALEGVYLHHNANKGALVSSMALPDRPLPEGPGWWPEGVRFEGCTLEANGDGTTSAGTNLTFAGHAARCVVRGCRVLGNAGADAGRYPGTDGITMHIAGPGHLIEHNVIRGHRMLVHNSDDGDGVDLKDSWNRTYRDPDTGALVPMLTAELRFNLIEDNEAAGLLLHQGVRHIYAHHNVIRRNRAGVVVKSGAALADQLEGRAWDPALGWGPGRVEGIRIVGNVVLDSRLQGVVLRQDSKERWHGGFRGVEIALNTIAGCGGAAVALVRMDPSAARDRAEAEYTGLAVRHNLLEGNGAGLTLRDPRSPRRPFEGELDRAEGCCSAPPVADRPATG